MKKKQKLEWCDMTPDERLEILNRADIWYRKLWEVTKLIITIPFLLLLLTDQKWKFNLYRKFFEIRKIRTENFSPDFPLVLDEQFRFPFTNKWIGFDFVELKK